MRRPGALTLLVALALGAWADLPLPDRFDVTGNPATDAKIARGCHDLSNFGADGRMLSLGRVGQPGRRNAPTVYKAGRGRYLPRRIVDEEGRAVL